MNDCEKWWNDTKMGNQQYLDKILSLFQFVRHESVHGLAWDRNRTSAVGGR
jgi:hypothetical protein